MARSRHERLSTPWCSRRCLDRSVSAHGRRSCRGQGLSLPQSRYLDSGQGLLDVLPRRIRLARRDHRLDRQGRAAVGRVRRNQRGKRGRTSCTITLSRFFLKRAYFSSSSITPTTSSLGEAISSATCFYRPVSLAWKAFGRNNGVADMDEFQARIRRYRRGDAGHDPVIGCIVLAQPFFLEQHDWIPVPESFKKNIVTGKSYESENAEGGQLVELLRTRLAAPGVLARDSALDDQNGFGDQERYGNPSMVRPRLGQGSFRVLVTETYQRRCALTGEKTLPVLEAAHIKPYAKQGPHRIQAWTPGLGPAASREFTGRSSPGDVWTTTGRRQRWPKRAHGRKGLPCRRLRRTGCGWGTGRPRLGKSGTTLGWGTDGSMKSKGRAPVRRFRCVAIAAGSSW